MGFGIEEKEYDPQLRRRNRIVIVTLAVLTIGATLIAGAVTEWPMKNALGIAGLLVLLHASLWWMFGSRRAGHLVAPTNWAEWRKRMNLN